MTALTVKPASVTIDGHAYTAQAATIKSTMLGYEDHGILTLYVLCEWPGGGIGVGGYALDQYDANLKERVPGALCGAQIAETLRVVGVDRWERLPGQRVNVLFDGESLIGKSAIGLADADLTRAVVWENFVKERAA